jgi:hypothetical protein
MLHQSNGPVRAFPPTVHLQILQCRWDECPSEGRAQGATLVTAQLTPVGDASYLVGAGELTDPCFGLFTFRITTASSQRDVFVTFQDKSVLFSSFSTVL